MIDTENLKVILDETINQLELILLIAGEEVNTGFLAFLNNNEGVVAAFSGFASVFVASVAIWYSMQANKKQREFQAELQAKQIKLDSYHISIKGWTTLSKIENFFETEKHKKEYFFKTKSELRLNKDYDNLLEFIRMCLDLSSMFTEIKFFLDENDRDTLEEIRAILFLVYEDCFFTPVRDNFIKDRQLLLSGISKVECLRKKIEQDLIIYDIQKIDTKS